MKIEKTNVMPENTPHSIAAGVVYFISQICKLNISKKDVKNVSEISEVTINKCYKMLEVHQETLIPASILAKYSNQNSSPSTATSTSTSPPMPHNHSTSTIIKVTASSADK